MLDKIRHIHANVQMYKISDIVITGVGVQICTLVVECQNFYTLSQKRCVHYHTIFQSLVQDSNEIMKICVRYYQYSTSLMYYQKFACS